MDLENELRQAMAEHVTEVSASRSLASDAKRRHHRTVRRRTAYVVGAAGLVVAVSAGIPAYQSFRPQPVGADGPGGQHNGRHAQATVSVTSSPTVGSRSGSPKPTGGSRSSDKPSGHRASPGEPDLSAVKALLGYLPTGITPAKTCDTSHAGGRDTTTCRWTGTGEWIEVRLVRGSGLKGPDDLGLTPPMPEKFTVHGHPALKGGGPAMPTEAMWIERHGLGVWVGVSPSLSDRLTRVAEGVHVT